MWQEEGFGLGLDVVMKEGYAGLIGASAPKFEGTPNSMKAYPMTLEPLWACGDCAGSPQALRSTVYGKALTQSTDNNFYVGTDRTANGRNWQIMAATETVSTEHVLPQPLRVHAQHRVHQLCRHLLHCGRRTRRAGTSG